MRHSFPNLDSRAFLEALKTDDLLEAPTAQRALRASEEVGTSIEKTLLEFGILDEDIVYKALAKHLDLPFIDQPDVDQDLVKGTRLPIDFLTRVEAVPVREDAEGLLVATSDPRANETLQSIGFHLGITAMPAIATPSTIKLLLAALQEERTSEPFAVASSDIERLRSLANDGPIIKLVNDIITKAVTDGASDIHVEAEEAGARIRFRIDGILRQDRLLSDDAFVSAVSRLKVMSNLNISEKRRPQDGRISLSIRGRSIDIRLSTLPTEHGESVVLRILDRNRLELSWSALGYHPDRVTAIKRILSAPNGIFLVAGPTGSGKTTTLYTALSQLNSDDRKIITVEDPVEYSLPGINQVQVDPAIDMTFARALRAILRQDPDIVMVGEIRDKETAEIAVRAALVGRLVLSTIHTNDSLAAIDRMKDLGVPPYLLASTMRGVLSQRLVRAICSDCRGTGCGECNQSGRRGRQVISELLRITPELSNRIATTEQAVELLAIAEKAGFTTLRYDARRLSEGGTCMEEEINRAVGAY